MAAYAKECRPVQVCTEPDLWCSVTDTRAKPAKRDNRTSQRTAEQGAYSLQSSRPLGKEVIGCGGAHMSKLREARARACVQVGGGERDCGTGARNLRDWIVTIRCTGEVKNSSTEDIEVVASIG